jgi:hypothetical protein
LSNGTILGIYPGEHGAIAVLNEHAGDAGGERQERYERGRRERAMSTRKTLGNAMEPEPAVFPGRELRRQEPKGRCLDADFRSALKSGKGSSRTITGLAGRDKHAIPHGETMDSLDDYPDLNSRRGRGRLPSFHMSEAHRVKIRNSNILNALIEHFEGKRKMSAASGSDFSRKCSPICGLSLPEFSVAVSRPKAVGDSHGMQTPREEPSDV